MSQIQKLTVKGYKSIKALEDFELRPLNVLIGANGAGKSNFISLFRFFAALAGNNFPVDMQKWGGPEALLHFGSKNTPFIDLKIEFSVSEDLTGFYENGYRLTLEATDDNRLIFSREEPMVRRTDCVVPKVYSLGSGHDSSRIRNDRESPSATVSHYVMENLQAWRQYHFNDTGDSATVKRIHAVNDNLRLKPDAANLAAYLRKLKSKPQYEHSYDRIVETIRRVAPFFNDFLFREEDTEYMQLEWTECSRPDTPWKAHVLSDGTLRFICLATLLLQPKNLLPDIILIDEPELGLHPFAINLLAEMLKEAAESKQVIVSTQSVELLNNFQPQDVVVVQREDDASVFMRLYAEVLGDLLAEDYSLGELWKRNVLGGRPTR